MKIFNSIESFSVSKRTIVTIGAFDGIHLGHQKILKSLIEDSQNKNLESIVLTFNKHPRLVLEKSFEMKLLTTNDEKIFLLKKIGIQNVIFQKFDKNFSELSGRNFASEILAKKLKAKKVVIGYDHRFGKNRECGIEDLIQFGKEFGFEVEQLSAEQINQNKVSSTKIRNAIVEGDILTANKFLGYNYFFSGEIVKGKQLGRTIGFPTANIVLEIADKILPKNGVYIVEGSWEGKKHQGMMNIGVKPTIGDDKLSIEVNFFDLEENLYDKKITIYLHKFIREEKKFGSIQLLKAQIEQDKNIAKDYFDSRKS